MNYTTNFNLNKPEGTDLYNHLTVDNPNMDTIDAQMQANKLASIGAATELVSGSVHAITRSDSNQNIFKFKATGNFSAGDTITVDGVTVNAYTTAGQPLLNNAYVLSAEVVCVLDNTSLWVLSNKTPYASDVNYDNISSGLVASDVQDAIDEVNGKVDAGLVQAGQFVLTLAGTAESQTGTVAFNTVFDDTPAVCMSISDSSRGSTSGAPKTIVDVVTTTRTDFTWKMKTDAVAAGAIVVNWIATTCTQ